MNWRARIELQLIHIGPIGVAGLGALLAAILLFLTWTLPALQQTANLKATAERAQQKRAADRSQRNQLLTDTLGFAELFPPPENQTERLRKVHSLAVRDGVKIEDASYEAPQAAAGNVSEIHSSIAGAAAYPRMRAWIEDLTTGDDPSSLDSVQFGKSNSSFGPADPSSLQFKLRLSHFVRDSQPDPHP